MATLTFTQDPDESDLWSAENVAIGPGRPPIHVMVQTDGEPPSAACEKVVLELLAEIDDKIFDAAEFLLDNYSYSHYKKLGLDDDKLLLEETAPAMVDKAVLRALWLFDEDGDGYELWFTVPWDPDHTYDVEFEGGQAIGCSVND